MKIPFIHKTEIHYSKNGNSARTVIDGFKRETEKGKFEYYFMKNEPMKNKFTVTRTYLDFAKHTQWSLVLMEGRIKMSENGATILLTVRPDFGFLVPVSLLPIFAVISTGNILPLFTLSIIIYILLVYIPLKVTGERMLEDFIMYSKMKEKTNANKT